MTRQEMYRKLERLYATTNWNSKESIHRYNEMARMYRQRVAEEDEKELTVSKDKGYNEKKEG